MGHEDLGLTRPILKVSTSVRCHYITKDTLYDIGDSKPYVKLPKP